MSEKTGRIARAVELFSQNYLWLIGLCLMLASAGIDGVYLMKWQAPGYEWFGQVLNTTADIAGMVVTYTYGTLRRSKSEVRRKRAIWLLGAEVLAVFYSWLFSWRQLLTVLQSVEPTDYTWMSWLGAAFIPLLLGFLGYAQSLKVDEFADERGEIKPEVVTELRGKLSDSEQALAKMAKAMKAVGAKLGTLETALVRMRGDFDKRPKLKCTKERYFALLKNHNGQGPKSAKLTEHQEFIIKSDMIPPKTETVLAGWIKAAGFKVGK